MKNSSWHSNVNKNALYRICNRKLLTNQLLKGKLVLQLKTMEIGKAS